MGKRTLYWDIETKSGANLRECGSYIYANDPTTGVLCLSYAIADGDPQLWLFPDPVPSVFFEIATNPVTGNSLRTIMCSSVIFWKIF
jgi:hypothetical protein